MKTGIIIILTAISIDYYSQNKREAEKFISQQSELEIEIAKFQKDTSLTRIINSNSTLSKYVSCWVMHSALNRQSAIQFNENLLLKEKLLNEQKKSRLLTIIALTILISSLIFLIYFIIKLRKNNFILNNNNLTITEQKVAIEHQKTEILDSINYSKRIQTAILPDINEIKSNIKDIFITYKPKDIVSGDFYYFNKTNNDNIIAAADCTGHGVPGAFMSLVGSKELKIANSQTNSPAKILEFLNNGVKETLKQNQIDGTKDGMDIAILKINGNNVVYSAANRPLWIIENNSVEIKEIKATKTAIAGHTADNQEFEEHELILNTGDTLYIFSDGYADQFGGEKQKKMTTKRFKDLLLSIQKKTMTEQQLEIESYIKNWQGDLEQVDDVLVIGIRI
jgi:serine phosphatase RsbU (regulator of sigma subunit)